VDWIGPTTAGAQLRFYIIGIRPCKGLITLKNNRNQGGLQYGILDRIILKNPYNKDIHLYSLIRALVETINSFRSDMAIDSLSCKCKPRVERPSK
jgi:hypothetical protein